MLRMVGTSLKMSHIQIGVRTVSSKKNIATTAAEMYFGPSNSSADSAAHGVCRRAASFPATRPRPGLRGAAGIILFWRNGLPESGEAVP